MKVVLLAAAAVAGALHLFGSVPSEVTVATGTHQVPSEVADAVVRHVPVQHRTWTLRMMACESGFDPLARNGSHHGLAQHARRYLDDRLARWGDGGTAAAFIGGDIDLQVRVTEGLRAAHGRQPWEESRWCWD